MKDAEFEHLVDSHYAALFRFAMSLAKEDAQAADLTQQTFYLWATRGHQLRDRTKAKSWLFTTLYREFLGGRRHEVRFPSVELDESHALPATAPRTTAASDGSTVMEALRSVDEIYRVPLTLFYLEEFSYKEIAQLIDVPIGTVMSRLSRGKEQLRRLLADRDTDVAGRVVPFTPPGEKMNE